MNAGTQYASSPCMAAERDPAYSDPLDGDRQQARDVARWRRAERQRLSDLRTALRQGGRARVSHDIATHLQGALSARELAPGKILSGYWPIKGEPDLRPFLAALHRAGVTIALPVVRSSA